MAVMSAVKKSGARGVARRYAAFPVFEALAYIGMLEFAEGVAGVLLSAAAA
jgi:hypothetical protein